MKRRNLLKLSALSSVFLLNNSKLLLSQDNDTTIIKPKRLNKGDKVALISPASNVTDPKDIYRAEEICEALNVQSVMTKAIVSNPNGYKTRSTVARVKEIHAAFTDSSIKAIFCIRGGFGSADLLDKLDYDLIKRNPKIIAGYSDITALITAIQKLTGLVTFHSPVMLSNFDNPSFKSFSKTITSTKPAGVIQNPKSKGVRERNPIITINSGKAEGELVGGNLSLITSLIGTDYQIKTKNKILFIEDVSEAPYRLERMLTQMRLAGMLDNLAGVVIGKCNDCSPGGSQSSWDRSELEVYNYIFSTYNYPVFYGLLIGHTSTQFTIPIGLDAAIDSDDGSLKILESAVI
jgi:muramoyltetrapeptide carboxypeptidase